MTTTLEAGAPAPVEVMEPWWWAVADRNGELRAQGYQGVDTTPCACVSRGGGYRDAHVQPCACHRCGGGRYQ